MATIVAALVAALATAGCATGPWALSSETVRASAEAYEVRHDQRLRDEATRYSYKGRKAANDDDCDD